MISETEVSQMNSTCSSEDETTAFVSSLFEGKTAEEEDDGGVFYFETDYAPLKANLDYLKLIRTLAILDVQRMKVCQDIDKLAELKVKVREDPEAVKKQILSGEAPFLTRCNIEKVPEIDWSKYKILDFDGKLAPTTRRMAKQPLLPKLMHQGGARSSENGASAAREDQDGKVRVRGRVYTGNKPETFNQLWTVEEQMRLEALLEEFPPEPVESRRWKKIAEALGNRTTKQVCSRVQKYFKKLQKVGIAVPGRMPAKSTKCILPNRVNKRHKHLLYRPTTFFPGEAMRALCGSDDYSGTEEEIGVYDGAEPDVTAAESVMTAPRQNLAHWVDILDTIRKEKENLDYNGVRHYGFRCYHCGEDPIVGTRWLCSTCPAPSVSFCCDCLALLPEVGDEGGQGGDEQKGGASYQSSSSSSSSESESWRDQETGGIGSKLKRRKQLFHPLSHVFTPCRVFSNPQYKPQLLGTENYLDPNFS